MKTKQTIYLAVGLAGICMLFAGPYWIETEYALAIGFAFLIFAIQGISRKVETKSLEAEKEPTTHGDSERAMGQGGESRHGGTLPDSKNSTDG